MATITPYFALQFFDQTGAALAGGKVYTYAAGTLTPKATYTTEAATDANANPVILDSAGRADIFLLPGEAYKFILTDSLDNTLDTIDTVTAMGTLGVQNSGAVAITGGTIAGVTITGGTFSGNAANVTGVVAIANGGTGVATAPLALTALGAAASGANTDITSVAADTTINAHLIGYRNVPPSAQTAAYVLTSADSGHCIDITTGGVNIPANATLALSIGFTFSVFNNSAVSQNISITTDTLRWAGSASVGTRALAQYGWVTCRKVAATTWVISGAGLS